MRLRKLPPNSTQETVRSMLLFAKDLIRVEMIRSPESDLPYATAAAYFRSQEAAHEAGAALHGKRPGDDNQELAVEVSNSSPNSASADPVLPDAKSAEDHLPKQNSRYSDTFREMDRVSPTQGGKLGRAYMDGSVVDGISPTFPIALPGNGTTFGNPSQSPVGQSRERQHISGRSMIQEDGADDEPNQIMQDPGSFMSAERQRQFIEQGRRATAPHISSTFSRMGSLSINSNVGPSMLPPNSSKVTSPRNGYGYQPPRNGAFSPQTGYGMGMAGNSFSHTTSPTTPQFQPARRNNNNSMPPVNPSDQNPPCNTLYVGNLAPDTSEDELKQLFSRVRGYRRLCFRMKHQGPMCFVEFEDTSHATRALKEYYGWQLSNSNSKGGIRLSFSKNPLGVRGSNHQSPISPNGNQMPGAGLMTFGGHLGSYGNMANQGFSTANGPPPGLPPPQQRNNSISAPNGIGHVHDGGFPNPIGQFGFQQPSMNGRGFAN